MSAAALETTAVLVSRVVDSRSTPLSRLARDAQGAPAASLANVLPTGAGKEIAAAQFTSAI